MISSSVIAAFLLGSFAAPAWADRCDELTYFTFSAPVSLPGVTLPAGTYRFSHPDCSHGGRVLQVSSQDGTEVYGAFLVAPDERANPDDAASVVFGETTAGAPEAIKAWFYPGDAIGDQLVYSGQGWTSAEGRNQSRQGTGGGQIEAQRGPDTITGGR